MGLAIFKQAEIYTSQQLVLEHCYLRLKMPWKIWKGINHQVLVKFWQNCPKQEAEHVL